MMHFNRETDVTKRWLVIFTLKLRVNIKNRMTFLIKKHNFAINRVITICILLLFSKDIKSFSLRLVIQSVSYFLLRIDSLLRTNNRSSCSLPLFSIQTYLIWAEIWTLLFIESMNQQSTIHTMNSSFFTYRTMLYRYF